MISVGFDGGEANARCIQTVLDLRTCSSNRGYSTREREMFNNSQKDNLFTLTLMIERIQFELMLSG